MTKKHYEAIADDLKTTRKNIHSRDYYIVDAICYALADTFAADNPKFNRDMFLTACGIKTQEKIRLNELMPGVFPNK
jgi:hypothetical protein